MEDGGYLWWWIEELFKSFDNKDNESIPFNVNELDLDF